MFEKYSYVLAIYSWNHHKIICSDQKKFQLVLWAFDKELYSILRTWTLCCCLNFFVIISVLHFERLGKNNFHQQICAKNVGINSERRFFYFNFCQLDSWRSFHLEAKQFGVGENASFLSIFVARASKSFILILLLSFHWKTRWEKCLKKSFWQICESS